MKEKVLTVKQFSKATGWLDTGIDKAVKNGNIKFIKERRGLSGGEIVIIFANQVDSFKKMKKRV